MLIVKAESMERNLYVQSQKFEAQWQAGVDVNEEREIPCLIPAVETSDGAAFSSFDVEHVKTACENVYMAVRLPNDHFFTEIL